MSRKGRASPQVIAAIIGLIGVLGAAAIANLNGIRGLLSRQPEVGGTGRSASPSPNKAPGKPDGKVASALRTDVYELPGQGTPNKNKTIGDFCCTGETATVLTTDGRPVGYVYVFAWQGQAFSAGGQTLVPGLVALLSGSVNVADPAARRDTGSVRFEGAAATPGATRTASAGKLSYVVTLTQANRRMFNGGWYIDLGSAHVRVQVSTH